MNTSLYWTTALLLCGLLVLLNPGRDPGLPASGGLTTSASQSLPADDGQDDFDFSIGTWVTRMSLLDNRLTDSTAWIEYEGTSVVRPIWNGRANMVELDVAGPTGSIVGLSLRLYDPNSGQWSLYYANSRSSSIYPPVIGGFKDGRGEFFGQEIIDGRSTFVRFVITQRSQNSWHYEQAFSDDGGVTWESNWIAVDTRVEGESDGTP